MEKPSQPHQITILTALNGFKVRVGCAEILFTSRHDLVTELGRYLADPNTVEKEYMEKAEYYQRNTPECTEPESTTDNVEVPSRVVERAV